MPVKLSRKTIFASGCLALTLAILALGVVLVLVVVGVVSVTPRSVSVAQTQPPPSDAYPLSSEQQALIQELGYPDAFTLLFYQADQTDQAMRLEIWTYYQLGQEVTMLNGQVIEQDEIDAIAGPLAQAPYRPEQFIGGMDFDAALQASRLEEYLQVPVEPTGIPGGTLLFGQQIALGFQDETLAYVESFALDSEVLP
jgi:hypothetical protein